MFSKIKACSTAKEIWEKLAQLCEGNDQTKENKIIVAIQMFDNVKMKPGETMTEFDERFSNIICELIALGKIYTNREIALEQGHFIANCTKPKNEERKQHYEKNKGKEGRRTYQNKKEQKVLVADEGKRKLAEIESDSTDTDISSEESEEERVQCLMANSIHEEDDTEVFDFTSSDFTQEELIQALNEMVTEYKKLSISFEEAKTEKACLIDKSRESSCLQQKELDGLRTKLNLLATENDNMKRVLSVKSVEKNSATERSTWYLDSGCSRHMTGNKDLLSDIIHYKGPKIIFGDNSEGKTVGKGKITHDRIRSDRGTEFLKTLESYLDDQGIKHELSAAWTPQQNGVAERRN
ncbi:uncharacterized protein [Henckelia pumila]|uniref:uncharacterized protein n=1 Tax=Henckelia pumila TaxID=405737 RepID=UPI003C6E2158